MATTPEERAAKTAAAGSDAANGAASEAAHVPETAENFEHTLRRLIAERNKARAANAGLYR